VRIIILHKLMFSKMSTYMYKFKVLQIWLFPLVTLACPNFIQQTKLMC